MRMPLLRQVVQARRLTQAHLDCLIRQIEARAERATITRRARARLSRPTTIWSRTDERIYQAEIDALSSERAAEIETLCRKLERQDHAIERITLRRLSCRR